MIQVHTCTTLELESQVWSGFEFATKSDQPGHSSSIRLEVMCLRTQRIIPVM